jgi:hypothetical protein
LALWPSVNLGRKRPPCAGRHLLRVRLTGRALCPSDCASDACFRLSYLHFICGCAVPTAEAQVSETMAGMHRTAAASGPQARRHGGDPAPDSRTDPARPGRPARPRFAAPRLRRRTGGHHTICTKSYAKPIGNLRLRFRKRGYAKGPAPRRRIKGIGLSRPSFRTSLKGSRQE